MWTVKFLNRDVVTELDALPKDQRAKLTWIIELIQEHGLENVRESYVKYLERGLWEIRIKGRDGISRALYVTARKQHIWIVRIFAKKTQKTPRREIKLALERAKDIG